MRSNKYQLLQMIPRDALPRAFWAVHTNGRPVMNRPTLQRRQSNVDRRSILPTTVASSSQWASTIVQLNWKHVATIDNMWRHFSPKFGIKSQMELPSFLQIHKFLYNTVQDRLKETSVPKNSSVRPSVSIEHRLNCDRHGQTQTPSDC